MRRIMLLAGAAALAAMPAFAGGQGRGNDRGQGQTAESAEKGRGQARAEKGRGREGRAERPGRGDGAERGRGQRAERAAPQERRAERAVGQERRAAARVDRGRPDRTDRVDERRAARAPVIVDRRDWRGWAERPLVRADRRAGDRLDFRTIRSRGLAVGPQGCPPGLARQNAWCMPPGQLRKAQLVGQRLPLAALPYNIPDRYRYRFADDDRSLYRYGDGLVYRFDRRSGRVSSVVPLVSTGLLPGEPLPLGYDVYNVPLAYRSYYPDTRDHLYRYDGGSIYRVNSDNMMVDGIVAMLGGGAGGLGGLGGLGIGDPLPVGYDAYNMPLAYRDRYYDRDDAWYRYADGAAYRVDPQTRLIQEVISLLV